MEENNKLIPIANNSLVQKATISLAITNKLVAENYRKKIYQVFEENPMFFIQIISKYYPLNDQLLSKFNSYWIWEEVQKNEYIEWNNELIDKHQGNINYFSMYYTKIENKNIIPKRITYNKENFIIKKSKILNNNNINWSYNFIEAYYNFWDWSELSNNKKINWTVEIIEKYIDKWNWENLSKNETLCWSETFINNFKNKWNWNNLSSNTGILWNEKLISRYKNLLNFNNLSYNSSVEWNESLLKNFTELFNCMGLSKNKNFPWTKKLIDIAHNSMPLNILISNISSNEKINWDIEFLNEYEFYFNWNELSTNNSLPWSYELIKTFENKWNWDNLSKNSSIHWDIILLTKYDHKLNWENLSFNNSTAWTVNLISKKRMDVEYTSILWEIIKPYVDDELIKEIIENNEMPILNAGYYLFFHK